MFPPMVSISGSSGSGKTALIESLIPRLAARGLRVGVLKAGAHDLEFDRPGKDTDRYRLAGAARVEAFDDRWWFQVAPGPAGSGPERLPAAFRRDVDLVLVEGGRSLQVDGIRVMGPDGGRPGPDTGRVIATVEPGEGGVARLEEIVVSWLESRWGEQQRAVVVLAGGASRRMGRPKQLIEVAGTPLLARTAAVARSFATRVVVAGRPAGGGDPAEDAPTIADVPGIAGPLGGMLAAMRWGPELSWLVLPCDHPRMRVELLEWLWLQRRPGVWAVMARDGAGKPHALVAVYEPQAAHVLEEAAAAGERSAQRILGTHPAVLVAEPPPELADALIDVDTPEQLEEIAGEA